MNYTTEITKPQNDKCTYHSFQLTNKLNVFLVEDGATDVACATMLVKIGHDYDTVLGIAHFLEHMLFNGTKKYPDEKEYSEYINKNGGYSNAFTDHDHTCYYYTIQPECLIKSLDMFGSFFVEPSLNPNSVNREKEAVNSEHVKNIFSDAWRLQDIMHKAVTKTNPIKNFGTGSNKTLDLPDIHVKVKEFFENHYSSDLMTLFVIAKDNIEKVKQQIITVFSEIPLKVTHENRQVFGNKIYDYPKMIKVVPVKKIEKIVMSWDVPSFQHSPLRCPHNFLSHLIGHEGKNTIHYVLTQLGYITNLSAGVSIHSADRCTFDVSMTLAPFGAQHRNDIIFTVIAYVNLLIEKINSPHLENLYNETLTLNAFEFKHSVKDDPEQRTMGFCSLVNNYNFDMKDILIVPYANENFNPHVKANLLEILKEMTIEKSVCVLVSGDFEDEAVLEDEYYGTKYNITTEYPNFANITIDARMLDLPLLNPFISIGDTIINVADEKPHLIPSLVHGDKIKLYCFPTNIFSTPEVSVKVKVDLPLSNIDAETYVKTVLYFSSLMAEINYDIYMCQTAHYNVSVYFDMGQLYITVSGNYEKIEEVCEFVVKSLLNKNLISEKIFGTSKYALEMADTNCIFNAPYTRTASIFSKQMCGGKYYDNYDRLAVVKNSEVCNITNVRNVIDNLCDLSVCTILVSGNCDDELATKIGDIFSTFVKARVYDPDMFLCDLYGEPSSCNERCIKNVENDVEPNSAMTYFVFIAKLKYGLSAGWNTDICLLNILDSIISTEYFDTLRTKEGFGYIANSNVNSFGDRRYLSRYYTFVVQSPHFNAVQIIDRTEKFIMDASDLISNITDDGFDEIVGAIVSSLEAPYNNLNELAGFVFGSEIETEFTSFNLKQVLINTYENLTKEDLIDFFTNKFIENRKALAVGLTGNKK